MIINDLKKLEIGNWRSAILLVLCVFAATACRRDMQNKPMMQPFCSRTFFSDGLSVRQPVEGTVPRGYLRTDTALFTGKKNKNLTNIAAGASATPAGPQPSANAPSGQNAFPDDVDTFPFPITEDTVNRGRQRFDIFCSVCHGKTGDRKSVCRERV